MKLLHIVGARPQFVKLAPVSKSILEYNNNNSTKLHGVVLHTGQHYDDNMSKIFFDELDMPNPDINLGVGSGSHAEQTAKMLIEIEKYVEQIHPDIVLTYGDTNSTLAGALVAAKLSIPSAHIEAGLRSFNRDMPEEVNRVVADHTSEILFAPTENAMQNLEDENLESRAELVGDVMLDAVLNFQNTNKSDFDLFKNYGVRPQEYCLATVHRAANTQTDELRKILQLLGEFSKKFIPVLFPMHPRTLAKVNELKLIDLDQLDRLKIIDPVSYGTMLNLLTEACVVITDSGGVQKEAFFVGTPCITLRDETEWIETVEAGANTLTGIDCDYVFQVMDRLNFDNSQCNNNKVLKAKKYFGDGTAAKKIVEILASV